MTLRKILRLFEIQDADQNDTDQIGLCWTPQAGNCSGVTNWIELGGPEKALWRRVNTAIDEHSIAEKEQYAVRNIPGGMFYAPAGDAGPWRWPSIVLGSKSALAGEFNQVNSLLVSKGYHKIESIPALDNYDYLSVETHPHLFMRTYCTNARGITYDTKAGIVYQPLFSPIGRRHARGNISGMWLRGKYVGSVVGTDVPPVEPPPSDFPYSVIVVRRTVLRQLPKATSSKIEPVARPGWVYAIYSEANGWGHTGATGWIQLQDTRRSA